MNLNMVHEEEIERQDLTLPPPEEEPHRQYYFIKKCREIVKRKSEELGRPLTTCSMTFGCGTYERNTPNYGDSFLNWRTKKILTAQYGTH